MRRALTPGTFDPITSGHLDVITRAAQLVDEVVVAVAASPKKQPLFSLEERAELVRQATSHLPNVRVEPFDELLVDFAARMEATVVVKGLREPGAGNAVHHVAPAVHVPVVVHRARDSQSARRRERLRAPVRERRP